MDTNVPPLPDVPPLPAAALLAEPRVVPAGASVQWIGTGWEMFKAAPGPWIGMVLIFIIALSVVGAVPLIGFVNVILQPILVAGLVAACEAQRTGTRPRVEHLFAGFQKDAGSLALVGVIYFAALLLVVVVVGGGGLAAMLPFIMLGSVAGEGFSVSPAMIGIIALCMVLAMLLFIPLAFAVGWAPALVYVHQVPPFDALKRGLFACCRNWLAVFVYVVLSIVMLCLTIFTLGLALLVVVPVLIIASWAAYREIFVA